MKTLSRFLVRDYSSIHIELPEHISNHVVAWGYENIPDSCIFFNPNRPSFGREKCPHITVLYGITGNQGSKIKDLINTIPPFEVTLGTTSLFYSEYFDVVKINVASCNLHQINSILNRSLNVVSIYPKYIPHVTVAYVEKNNGEKYRGLTEFSGKKIQVNELTFSLKNGTKQDIKLGVSNA